MSRSEGQLRIVGGRWRSRRLRFPSAPGLRPTPDRLRETLFDWLDQWIVGRRVLDLYAGSGALGIEALSRGATEAIFIERAPAVAAALRENIARLGAEAARVECADALAFLAAAPGRFDLVFVDPPWSSDLAAASLELLVVNPLLSPDHRVYLEQPAPARAGRRKRRSDPSAGLPGGWEALKSARSGGARSLLLHREAGAPKTLESR